MFPRARERLLCPGVDTGGRGTIQVASGNGSDTRGLGRGEARGHRQEIRVLAKGGRVHSSPRRRGALLLGKVGHRGPVPSRGRGSRQHKEGADPRGETQSAGRSTPRRMEEATRLPGEREACTFPARQKSRRGGRSSRDGTQNSIPPPGKR